MDNATVITVPVEAIPVMRRNTLRRGCMLAGLVAYFGRCCWIAVRDFVSKRIEYSADIRIAISAIDIFTSTDR